MFAELQIRRPVLAAVYFGLSLAVSMALLGAAYGRPLGDILLELPIALIMTTAFGAVVNKQTRPGLAGLTAEQVRRVVRWVHRGEVVDDRAVAKSVIVYVRNQERQVWGAVCLALLTFSAVSVMVTGDDGMSSALLAVGLIGAGVINFLEQRRARSRRRAAEAAARSLLLRDGGWRPGPP